MNRKRRAAAPCRADQGRGPQSRHAPHLDLTDFNSLYAPAAYFDGYIPRGWPESEPAAPAPRDVCGFDHGPGLTGALAALAAGTVLVALAFLVAVVLGTVLHLAWLGAAHLAAVVRAHGA